MATSLLYPTAIEAMTNLTGSVADIDESPSSADGAWLLAASPSTPELVGSSSVANSGLANSVVIPKPTGVQSGDVLVFAIATAADTSLVEAVVASGFTVSSVESAATIDSAVRVFKLTAGGSEPSSYTFQLWSLDELDELEAQVSANATGACVAYRNAVVSVAANSAAGAAYASPSFSYAAPSVTSPDADAVLLCVWAFDAGESLTNGTPPGSMSEIVETVNTSGIGRSRLMLADEQLTATGSTGTRTATITGDDHACAMVSLCLEPA